MIFLDLYVIEFLKGEKENTKNQIDVNEVIE